MKQEIIAWARERGYKVKLSSIELLQVVLDKLERRMLSREIRVDFFARYFNSFTRWQDLGTNGASSVILIAKARPAHTFKVEFRGKIRQFIFPPTYVKYQETFYEVLTDFKQHFERDKFRVTLLSAPLKSLAVHTGLAVYGKNNITYIPEFGSYFQLIGIVTNLPVAQNDQNLIRQELMAAKCRTCQACVLACPLQAISSERFLLFAEKCYVSYSESPEPLPSGMKSPSPDCIIGCLKCQEICPMNRGKLGYEDTGIHFTAPESEVIINNQTSSPLWNEIKKKLENLGLSENYQIQLRNLRHLLLD